MPFSSCSPRSSNSRPVPWTRAQVVSETSTSPGPALDMILAASCTASPRTSVPATTTSPGVHAGADLEAFAHGAPPDRARAAEGAGRCVEHREDAVAGRADLAAAKALELHAHGRVVHLQALVPGRVAGAEQRRRRLDDVREQQGDERALVKLAALSRKCTHPHPLDQHARLVADRVAVVSRRDVVDIAGTELDLGAVAEDRAPGSRDDDADVTGLAPFAPDDGLDVLRPAPTRVLDGAGDGHAADLDHVLLDARELDGFVG